MTTSPPRPMPGSRIVAPRSESASGDYYLGPDNLFEEEHRRNCDCLDCDPDGYRDRLIENGSRQFGHGWT